MSAPHELAQAARDAIAWKPPYPYADVLAMCVAQVTTGKGEERHGRGRLFMQQHWRRLAMSHSPGFLTGQAEKKWIEANESIIARDDERYIREVVGAIVYSLMALIMCTDRNVADGRLTPQREGLSAAVWLTGVWPNQADFESYQNKRRAVGVRRCLLVTIGKS